MKGTVREGGEIVQVQGGHIIRSTGQKDRHSKVHTLKGPRDRRVRLSAHTAIQFYDVQDRLGYDRPSKAVDWLIQKAKNAIDKLNKLNPSWPNAIDKLNKLNPSWPHQSLDHHVNQATDQPTTDSNRSSNELPLEQPQVEPLIMGPSEAHVASSMRSFFPTRASEELETFNGWNNVGFVANSIPQQEILFPFSQREILQSNLLAWNHQQSFDQIQGRQSSDFGTPFELGFRVPARIYGDQQESSDGT